MQSIGNCRTIATNKQNIVAVDLARDPKYTLLGSNAIENILEMMYVSTSFITIYKLGNIHKEIKTLCVIVITQPACSM